jgi:ferredoxin
MAERTERLPQNVPGPYYVDSTCIDCDLCRSTAPDSFKRDEEIGMTIVYRQPITPEEQVLAEQAKQACPTESIGSDGLIEAKSGSRLISTPMASGNLRSFNS